MASQSQGIQQLLQAEKRAAEKVAEARKREYQSGPQGADPAAGPLLPLTGSRNRVRQNSVRKSVNLQSFTGCSRFSDVRHGPDSVQHHRIGPPSDC